MSIWVQLGWVFILIAGGWSVFTLWPVVIGAGFEPTSRGTVRKMLEMAGVGPDDVVFDLGSGDGRLLVEASKARAALAVGVEADPIRVVWSKVMIAKAGTGKKTKVIWGNFFHTDLRPASVITLFLMKGTNTRLKTKFSKELKPGTRIVSHEWIIEGWSPVAEDKEKKIYLYRV